MKLDSQSISVLIPVRDQSESLRGLLLSLRAAGFRGECIVVDDGSSPNVAHELRREFPEVRFFRHDQSLGAAAARNRAAREATGSLFLFLDSDTELVAGSLEALHRRFERTPELAALNGGATEDPLNLNEGFAPRYRAYLDFATLNLQPPERCSFFVPRCAAVTRAAFEKVGGFDTRYLGALVEDYEFGYRLAATGTIGFDAALAARHRYPGAAKQASNLRKRVRAWMPLFLQRRRFDNFGASRGPTGAGSLLITAGTLFLFTPPGAMLVLLGLALGHGKFLREAGRRRGVGFALRCAGFAWLFSLPITLGALLGAGDWAWGWLISRLLQKPRELA